MFGSYLASRAMGDYCPHCTCENCGPRNEAIARRRREQEARLQSRREKEEAAARVREEKRAESLRQAAMIWMLTNHAVNSTHAQSIMYEIAVAMDLTVGEVNRQRIAYVTELNRRADLPPATLGKIPGTQGSDIMWPECEKCGSPLNKRGHHRGRRKECPGGA